MIFGPPEVNAPYVEVGGDLAPLKPTTYLRFSKGMLEQWYEAASGERNGTTHCVGEWRRVSEAHS